MARKNSRRRASSRKPNKTSKKDKSHHSLSSDNLQEKSQQEQGGANDEHSKTTTTKSEAPKSTAKSQEKYLHSSTDVDVNAVPAPAPDTGLASTFQRPATIHTGILPVIPSRTITVPPTSGFSPLPPFTALSATTSLITFASSSLPTTAGSRGTSVAPDTKRPQAQTPKHLPTVIIALLAVGVAFLLSLEPSLSSDAFSDRNVHYADEESLFGGKERISGRPGSNVLWTWTQYTQPSVNKPQPALIGSQKTADTEDGYLGFIPPKTAATDFNEKGGYPFAVETTSNCGAPSGPPPLQQVQSALTRAANRVSAMSMSMYPGSPQSTIPDHSIGIAVGGASPLTADGMPVLQRSASKASTRRLSKNRRSLYYSSVPEKIGPFEDPSSDVYGGAQMMSPQLPIQPVPKVALRRSNSIQGRARVKAPYGPGSLLPRRRPPSPQPTLYPDDSITLAGDRRHPRLPGHNRVQSEAMSPSMEASARLGNLMLEEFTSMASLAYARPPTGIIAPSSTTKSKIPRKRADDKPPRVPSPPPLPSLAQMALAHTNPEDYTDYRSPTYSIYGLYEAQRKSRLPGEGGY
ncbi:hypothetical protein A0H81_04293 [Grifola frondosa]|uniref:Transmembrane protein n=1 Tax=Grifola frondosa TaxID=5627 RepID=A0A1C7MFM3_GRIFR|nr:hypothetical protein A0H81_04293 [Grifola frondosa]